MQETQCNLNLIKHIELARVQTSSPIAGKQFSDLGHSPKAASCFFGTVSRRAYAAQCIEYSNFKNLILRAQLQSLGAAIGYRVVLIVPPRLAFYN